MLNKQYYVEKAKVDRLVARKNTNIGVQGVQTR